MNTQYSLMWKPYCMWCVSMNVCVPFSLWWMCNEVAKASIQQFSIYELLTLERRDLNITPSWNNSTSVTPSPARPSVFLLKASHAKQMVRREIQAAETATKRISKLSCFTYTADVEDDASIFHLIKFCCLILDVISIQKNNTWGKSWPQSDRQVTKNLRAEKKKFIVLKSLLLKPA